jgi:origin recognition complex subunit 5
MPIADLIYPEVATLQRLRLLVPASSAAAATRGAIDGGEKWCLNVDVAVGSGLSHNGEWMIEMGKSIGVDIEEYVAALLG